MQKAIKDTNKFFLYIPYSIQTSRPLGKNEYVLRVEGKSMEPVIMDGSMVIMRKHTIPPHTKTRYNRGILR